MSVTTYEVTVDDALGWTRVAFETMLLHALRFTRDTLQNIRDEEVTDLFSKQGIYFLFGPEEECPRRLYIGQAGPRSNPTLGVLNRMGEMGGHADISDWVEGFFLVRMNDYFAVNRNRLDYLERKLIKEVKDLYGEDAQRPYKIVNDTRGNSSRVPPADQSALDVLIHHCKTMLRLVGLPVFNPPRQLTPLSVPQSSTVNLPIESLQQSTLPSSPQATVMPTNPPITLSAMNENISQQIYFHSFNGKIARCIKQSDNKCILLKNSYLQKASQHSCRGAQETRTMRHELRDKFIGDDINGYYTIEDIKFRSLNQAGMFASGNAACETYKFWKLETGPVVSTTPSVIVPSPVTAENSPSSMPMTTRNVPPASHEIFFFESTHGTKAKGFLAGDGRKFTVCAGSKARVATENDAAKVRKYRNVNDDSINALGIFLRDTTFSSSSVAACFVDLNQRNGLNVWINSQHCSLGDVHPELRRGRRQE